MKTRKIIIFSFLIALIFSGCYPLSVARMKWRIHQDKDKKHGKETFFADEKSKKHKEKPPNIIILLCDDLGKYEVSAKGVAGAVFGLALATYVWKLQTGDKPLSKLLSRLSNVVEQLENIEMSEEEDIKERIKKILSIIETNNDNTKK